MTNDTYFEWEKNISIIALDKKDLLSHGEAGIFYPRSATTYAFLFFHVMPRMSTISLFMSPVGRLFGLMIPLFSQIGQGIGALPAITAVFLYSLLPIVRNTHTALENLPSGLREAGRGIGMTFWQRLRWVEIPMALPVIFGGIRTAVVMNVGVMAIAAVIGAGGLGLQLLDGIGGSDVRMLIAGALMICLLAIFLDWLLHRLQLALTPRGIR